MKTLTPDTKVRLAPWDRVTCATFNTVRGCAARDGRDVKAALDRAIANRHHTAFATHAGSMICADRGFHDEQKAKAAGAVTLHDGEVIAVTGEPELYRVKVVEGNLASPRNSDPIHFEVIDAVMADSYSQEVGMCNGRAVTRGEAAAAFDMVKDDGNWKNPIDTRLALTDDQLALVTFAVPFFAGCAVEIFPTGKFQPMFLGSAQIYRVMAAGYYEAVGA